MHQEDGNGEIDLGLPESTLLVIPCTDSVDLSFPCGDGVAKLNNDFAAFHRLSWDIQAIIVEMGLAEELQLVLFHPQAVHSIRTATVPETEQEYYDPSFSVKAKNFAIRSPFPTFHFLRTKDIVSALQGGYRNPELILERNAARLEKLHEYNVQNGGVWSIWKNALWPA
jgi:hypothetical protein